MGTEPNDALHKISDELIVPNLDQDISFFYDPTTTKLRKRFEFFNIIPKGHFAKVKFTVLEEQMYGVPIYKQDWFRQRRTQRGR